MAQSTYGLEQKDIADIGKMLVASGAAGTHGGEGYINSGQFDSQGNVFANYFEGKGQSAPFATYDKIGNRSFSQDAYQSWLNNPANLQGLLSSMYPNGDRNLSSGPGGYSYANGTPITQIPDRDAPGSGLPTPGQTPGMVLPGAPSSQPIAPPTYNKPGAPNILGKPSVGTPGQYSLAGGFDSQYANPYTVNGQTFFSQNGPVDTSTPNPNSVNAAPYTQGLAAMQQSGQKAPQDAASARTAVAGASAPGTSSLAAQQRSAAVAGTLQNDPNYQQLLADYQEYNHVANQQKSLVDTYQQLISAAGIPGIDASLLNSKRIIDGTEDDIRSEVQAVSGFATDSQVQALASARNKVLIKNYNNLLNTKTLAMQQVQTMIGLAAQDQENALSHITQKLNIDAQIADYSMKFQANAAAAYERVIQAVGYQGLLQSLSSDPSAVSLAEQTLGLAPGGLQQIATQQQNTANLKNLADYSITTPYVITASGEVQNSQTGVAYSSPQDFQQQTGMSLDQAGQKGLIKPLGLNKEETQQQFKNQVDLAQLELQQQQVNVSKQNAAISGGNLVLAREKFAYDVQKDLGTDTGQGKLSDYQLQAGQNIINSIDKLIPKVTDKVTGKNATFYNNLPGLLQPQEYKDFKALLEPIKTQVFTQTLQAMRDASKTGGAVGQVSDVEGKRFENALGSLDNTQSAAQFKSQLDIIKDSVRKWEQAMVGSGISVAPDGTLVQITE